MAAQQSKKMIYETIEKYVDVLKRNNIPVWRVYLYGSHVKNRCDENSDIDLAVFWDKEDIDGFDENVQLLDLTRSVDLRIEPHSFAKSDYDETNPFVKEIISSGERII